MSLLSRRPGTSSTPPGSGYSLFDSQLTVHGDIDTSGSLRVDGQLNGTVRRADTVVLGVGATMTGDVHAREPVRLDPSHGGSPHLTPIPLARDAVLRA